MLVLEHAPAGHVDRPHDVHRRLRGLRLVVERVDHALADVIGRLALRDHHGLADPARVAVLDCSRAASRMAVTFSFSTGR
jgi:hypothetical protein